MNLANLSLLSLSWSFFLIIQLTKLTQKMHIHSVHRSQNETPHTKLDVSDSDDHSVLDFIAFSLWTWN